MARNRGTRILGISLIALTLLSPGCNVIRKHYETVSPGPQGRRVEPKVVKPIVMRSTVEEKLVEGYLLLGISRYTDVVPPHDRKARNWARRIGADLVLVQGYDISMVVKPGFSLFSNEVVFLAKSDDRPQLGNQWRVMDRLFPEPNAEERKILDRLFPGAEAEEWRLPDRLFPEPKVDDQGLTISEPCIRAEAGGVCDAMP